MNNSEHDAQKETPVLVSRLHRMASLSKNLNTTSIKFNIPFDNSKDVELMQEAAVEIERLQEENDILRNAVVVANSANRKSSMDQLALSESQDRWRDLAVKLLDQNVKNLDLLDEIDLLRNKVQDLQAYAEQDSCIVDRLRWQLMHSIYCPRQACHICSEIEKEICHG